MSELNLTEALKSATQQEHESLQALPFSKALETGVLPIESYVGYLRAMAVVHAVLEHESPVESEPLLDQVWHDELRKLPVLQRDLVYFTEQKVADIPAAQDHAVAIANRLLGLSEGNPVAMLGYLYVLEGASQGAPTLAAWVENTYTFAEGRGIGYLQHSGTSAADRWGDFRRRMDKLDLDEGQRNSIIEAAIEAFQSINRVMSALYPFEPAELGRKVVSLNPEAGAHPTPQSPQELEAVERAAKRSFEEYPYFAWRYGERGWRFTLSDGAWLVTLAKYPQERIHRQVKWLTTVLSTRGIPGILLQRHLELTYEALRECVSGSEAHYRRLLKAADRMQAERVQFGSEEEREAIGHEFQRAVGADWMRRLPGTAEILISAVIDERLGIEGALESTVSWHRDDTLFPPEWIAAVDLLVEKAKALPGPVSDD